MDSKVLEDASGQCPLKFRVPVTKSEYSTTTLGDMLKKSAIIKYFHMFKWYFLCFSVFRLHLVLSLGTADKYLSLPLLPSKRLFKDWLKSWQTMSISGFRKGCAIIHMHMRLRNPEYSFRLLHADQIQCSYKLNDIASRSVNEK